MRHVRPIVTIFLCTIAFLASSRQAAAQTPESEVSADWQALGWTLPKSFAPDQLALFKGLNAARGTWSFEAESAAGDSTTAFSGKLVATGGSQGGMTSAWSLIWSWPAKNPQHAIVEQFLAVSDKEQHFALMLVRFGPLPYSEAHLMQRPKVPPTIFDGQWDAEKQSVSWTPGGMPGKQGKQAAGQEEDAAAPAFEMIVAPDGKISIQNSENLPSGQIATGGATARAGDVLQEADKPEFLAGMHRFKKGAEISDPRVMRYLPVEATDIKLVSDRSGHMAHYRISAEAFDTFLADVWRRYREEVSAQPKSWEHYSEEDITAAREGSPVGRYEPKVRSSEIIFAPPHRLGSAGECDTIQRTAQEECRRGDVLLRS